jgi:Aspartyl protease
MPRMTVPYDPRDGMLIEVEICCPGSPTTTSAPVTLLVDTGSTRTHLTSQIANHLGLPFRGMVPVISMATTHHLESWTADISIPALQMTFADMRITDFLQPGLKQAGVLGRDILSRGVLLIDGPNRTATLAF